MRILLTWLLTACAACAQGGMRSPVFVANLAPRGASASFPSGATHYWAFADNLNDGVGAFTLVDADASYVAGKNGQCLVVESGESVTTGANTISVTTAFSTVKWVWVSSGALFDFSIGTAGLNIAPNDGVFTVKVGSLADDMVSDPYTLDAWSLVIVTYDGSSVEQLSVNGVTFITGTVTTEGVSGALSFSGSDADVRIDELTTFTRVLTQQEVADIWNGGTGRFGP